MEARHTQSLKIETLAEGWRNGQTDKQMTN